MTYSICYVCQLGVVVWSKIGRENSVYMVVEWSPRKDSKIIQQEFNWKKSLPRKVS